VAAALVAANAATPLVTNNSYTIIAECYRCPWIKLWSFSLLRLQPVCYACWNLECLGGRSVLPMLALLSALDLNLAHHSRSRSSSALGRGLSNSHQPGLPGCLTHVSFQRLHSFGENNSNRQSGRYFPVNSSNRWWSANIQPASHPIVDAHVNCVQLMRVPLCLHVSENIQNRFLRYGKSREACATTNLHCGSLVLLHQSWEVTTEQEFKANKQPRGSRNIRSQR
jgi:hypothetical protein